MVDVRFVNVYKRYGSGAPVIRNLDLHVRDTEFLVVVGPSGCGKTTALRLIAGLERPTAGDLYLGDQRITEVPAEARNIAMVFQGYALFPHMTVFEYMAFSLRVRHLSRQETERRVSRAAGALGIDEYLDRKPWQLSGGQQQRVALGRALVHEPRVFLMDEPLSNLDARLRVRMRAEIARLHQRVHVTTLYVTHDQAEAMTMGDRIAVMHAGVIEQLGPPQELYDAPANLFVAGFLGSPSMDFFAARLQYSAHEPVVIIGAGAEARTLPLSAAAAARLAGGATDGDREVVVGIRPEHLRLAGESDDATLRGEVEVVEHLGNEQVVYLRVPGALASEEVETTGITARIPSGMAVRPGERVILAPEIATLHVFDRVTTERLA